jgi:hypothetical protein
VVETVESNEGIMKKTSLTGILGFALIGACATTETGEDLCNPHDETCRLKVLVPGTNTDAGSNTPSGGMGGGGSAGMTSGAGTGGQVVGGAGNAGMSGGGTSGAGGTVAGSGGMSGGGTAGTGGGGTAGTAGGGGGGTAGAAGTAGAGGAPECTVANEATVCNDNDVCTDDSCDGNGECQHDNNTAPCPDEAVPNACTDDVCEDGVCVHNNNTASCAADNDLCTDNVCAAGACTHPAINPCGGTVVIRANRGNRNYVNLGAGNQLFWNATTQATAEQFEAVFTGTDQIKLRAMSTGMFVDVDAAQGDPDDDFLYATADEAGAAVINIPLCATVNGLASNCTPNCRAFEVTDDNSSRFVASDDQGIAAGNKLRGRSGDCGGSASAWESWEFIEVQ